tara:strand:- start:729 stop:1421 length:693 start_codon:yes stop_codon:yes gene_type:complete
MPPKTADESFWDFVETFTSEKQKRPLWADPKKGWFESPSDPKGYNTYYNTISREGKENLYNLWKEAGSPYVKQTTPSEFSLLGNTFTGTDDPRAFFTHGKRTVWDYLGEWEKGRYEEPDTLNIQYGDMDEFLAELAHAEQFKDKWAFGPATKFGKSYAARDKHGDDVYNVEYLESLEPVRAVDTSYYTGREFPRSKTKSIEWEAHKDIQPPMVEKIMPYIGEDETPRYRW